MSLDIEVAKLVGRFAAMRQLAARAARENPQDVRARFGAAMALRISGDYRAAGAQGLPLPRKWGCVPAGTRLNVGMGD